MIKIVASDVDGTLVPDGTFDISPLIFDVIKQLKEKNIKFVAASGRQYASLKRLFAPVASDIYYITDNGGFVRDNEGNAIMKNPIKEALIHSVTEDILKIENAEPMLCGVDFAYVREEADELYRWMRDSYHYNIKKVPDIFDIDDDIVKVSIYHPTDAESYVKEWFFDKWKDTVLVASAGINWVDCMRFDIGKEKGLSFLMERFGVSKDEVMVFGDNINDLGMLSCAKESYAIGSARDEVKACAAYVADTMQNQGVIKVILEKLLSH